MWPRSARFDAAVVESHTVALHAALWRPGQRALIVDNLELVGGSVTASRTASNRRVCSVNLVDRDGSLSRVFPKGRRTVPAVEIVLKRGIQYANGAVELLPLGVFGVSGAAVKRGSEYTLTGYDRARRVARNRFTSPYVVAAGQRYVDAAAALVANRLPFPIDAQVTATSGATISNSIVCLEQDDPWADAGKLCSAAGAEMFWDQIGRLIIQDIAVPSSAPDWRYLDGENSVILDDTEWTLSDDPGYNAVLALGESTDNTTAIPRALVVDDDPTSPTYYYGDYGAVPEFYSSPLLTTDAMAAKAGATRLQKRLGANDTMTLATVPHPAHDPGDTVRVRYYDIDELMIADSVSIPLDATSAASLSVRAQNALEDAA